MNWHEIKERVDYFRVLRLCQQRLLGSSEGVTDRKALEEIETIVLTDEILRKLNHEEKGM